MCFEVVHPLQKVVQRQIFRVGVKRSVWCIKLTSAATQVIQQWEIVAHNKRVHVNGRECDEDDGAADVS